jgi:hypothetical protein
VYSGAAFAWLGGDWLAFNGTEMLSEAYDRENRAAVVVHEVLHTMGWDESPDLDAQVAVCLGA